MNVSNVIRNDAESINITIGCQAIIIIPSLRILLYQILASLEISWDISFNANMSHFVLLMNVAYYGRDQYQAFPNFT